MLKGKPMDFGPGIPWGITQGSKIFAQKLSQDKLSMSIVRFL